jgi:hypothetical protein
MSSPERGTGSDAPGGPPHYPFRDELLPLFERSRKLERENTDLRRLVFALLFALLVVAGLAGWWFSIAWLGRR